MATSCCASTGCSRGALSTWCGALAAQACRPPRWMPRFGARWRRPFHFSPSIKFSCGRHPVCKSSERWMARTVDGHVVGHCLARPVHVPVHRKVHLDCILLRSLNWKLCTNLRTYIHLYNFSHGPSLVTCPLGFVAIAVFGCGH